MFGLMKKSGGGADWIVAFLGNPGRRYDMTRHNAGFLCAGACEAEEGVRIDRLRFQALTGHLEMEGQSVLLMKPQTYMNLSGEAVGEAARFFKIPAERVLAVSDEVSLPLGKLRVRKKGSAGGHNGLKNIIAHLGTEDFPRVRIGVGAPPHPDYDMADWVLARLTDKEAEELSDSAKRAWAAVKCLILEGPDRAMNKFN